MHYNTGAGDEMSSRYTKAEDRPPRRESMRRWKVMQACWPANVLEKAEWGDNCRLGYIPVGSGDSDLPITPIR